MEKGLTRNEILNFEDIKIKQIKVPVWGDRIVYIKQLTRGQQDTLQKRQYGSTRLNQDSRAQRQEITAVNIFGHDTFIFVCGVCDEVGKAIFTQADIPELEKKNGEAIGYVATEILRFSGVSAKEENELNRLEEELKN